jgi:hypothetical protein
MTALTDGVERRPRPALLAGLLLGAALLSGFTILRGYGPHDEGLMLAWADRVAGGQWPYRDFWSNYAPGQTVVLAGLTKLFGPSLLSWRLLRVALDALIALLAYLLVRREAGERIALLAWLAVAGAMAFPSGPGPNAPALALGLGALLLAPERRGWAGAAAGLAVVFRPEIGLAALAGAALLERRQRARLIGAAALVAVAALLPFAVVAPSQMADQIVGFLGIQHLQRLPFPLDPHTTDPNKLLERLFPALLVAATALAAARALVTRTVPAALPLAAIGLLYLLGRADEFHLVPLSVALAVVLAVQAGRARGPWRAALLAAVGAIALHGLERRATQLVHPPALAAVPGPAGDGVRTGPQDARALRALRAAVDRLAPPGAPIFVADPRHDLVRAGDPLLYVLLGRANATRYDVMQPGVVTTADVQREIVADLARAPVVVRWRDPTAARPEPNGAGRSSGVHLLDEHLARAYVTRGRFGPYELLQRVKR